MSPAALSLQPGLRDGDRTLRGAEEHRLQFGGGLRDESGLDLVGINLV